MTNGLNIVRYRRDSARTAHDVPLEDQRAAHKESETTAIGVFQSSQHHSFARQNTSFGGRHHQVVREHTGVRGR